MWISLQYLESSVLKNACTNAHHKDGLGIFHPSRIEIARPKDGWTDLWLRPCIPVVPT